MTRESLAYRTHQWLHQLPGMPDHSQNTRLNHRGGLPNRALKNRLLRNRPLRNTQLRHGHKEPRVLVSWQKAIAGLLSRRST
jgi:hypothetical protein